MTIYYRVDGSQTEAVGLPALQLPALAGE
jgi:hypothetical protein